MALGNRASKINAWGLTIASASTSSTTLLGTTVTPGNNTYGTYAQLIAGASVTDDVYQIEIAITGAGVSGSAKDCIVTIGLDPSGGTTYTDTILDLLGSCSLVVNSATSGLTTYMFPLFIKAGASIAAKASTNNATVGTIGVQCRLRCKPSRPDLMRVGSFVRTFGSTPASSNGTGVTPGNSLAKGSYVQLGSNTAETLWHWQLGVGINNNTMNNNGVWWDLALGDGTNKAIVVDDQLWQPSAGETLVPLPGRQAYWEVPSGVGVYARAASGSTALTGWSAAAYAVGG